MVVSLSRFAKKEYMKNFSKNSEAPPPSEVLSFPVRARSVAGSDAQKNNDHFFYSLFQEERDFLVPRKRMIYEQIMGRGITDQNVIRVMAKIPRHIFVDDALKNQAYSDCPVNIGQGQTISQPYIVALMSQALELAPQHKVLEIGMGCGYQTVILSQLCQKVYSIERFQTLGLFARRIFKQMKLRNIIMRIGDGSYGWKEGAPFDRILCACVAPHVPRHLLSQLAIGGILVIPVSQSGGTQKLMRVTRSTYSYSKEDLGECRFVPMVGKYAF